VRAVAAIRIRLKSRVRIQVRQGNLPDFPIFAFRYSKFQLQIKMLEFEIYGALYA
jgi:hypothetical protein